MGLKETIDKVNKAVEESKKLTTKTRKALPAKVFCGPNRSFPVPDCKHVAVAKAYLGRSKFSAATKKKIAACINRRAKALKCNVSKKAKADVDLLSDSPVFETTKKMVEESIKNPGIDLKFPENCC